jgi:NADPH:quinone reductase-like Zn-dependent oxidoreductase
MKKLNVAAAHGATTVIDLSQPRAMENLAETVKECTDGEGVHVVYDPVGGKVFANSLRATRWGAKVAIVGFASGIRSVADTVFISFESQMCGKSKPLRLSLFKYSWRCCDEAGLIVFYAFTSHTCVFVPNAPTTRTGLQFVPTTCSSKD